MIPLRVLMVEDEEPTPLLETETAVDPARRSTTRRGVSIDRRTLLERHVEGPP